MDLTVSELIVWLIVGALVGPVVGAIVTRKKEGFGLWANLGIGMAGALIGPLIFHLFGIETFLKKIEINLQGLVAALLGTFLFILGVWVYRKIRDRRRGRQSDASA